MRRSAGWVCPGATSRGSAGSGRLLVWVIVGDERDDVVGGEEVAAAEVGEFYEEGDAGYGASRVLDELAHGAGGAPGGEQVVCDEDAGAGVYGVSVGLEGVRAVLEVVGGGDGLSGELVRFAGEDEAFAGAVGQSRAEDEAAGLGGEDAVVFPQAFGEAG